MTKTDVRTLALVVDDEPEFLEELASILESLGFDVSTAGSGNQAIELLEPGRTPRRPDLVITDCQMADGSGFDLLYWIRASKHPDTPVLMISGAVSYEEIEAVATQPPVAILLKPFKKAMIHEKLQKLLAIPGK